MPELHKPLPYNLGEWITASSEDIEKWIDHLANEYVYRDDERGYDFLATLSATLRRDGWTYTPDSEARIDDQKEAPVMDEALIDIRKFALQKALEAGEFKFDDDEVKSLIKHAKKIEKYILGTAD